jgi:hypothetical protein
MKMFIIDVYKIFFKITGNTMSAVALAVFYASLLNIVVIYYIGYLLEGLSDNFVLFIRHFSIPYLLVLLFGWMAYNSYLLMPFKKLSRRSRMPQRLAPIIAYSMAAILLVVYGKYCVGMF